MLISIVALIAFLIIVYLAFVNFYPSFGGHVSEERKAQYESSQQFKDGLFVNVKDVPKEASFSETLTIARKFFFQKVENGRPDEDLKVQKIDSTAIAYYQEGTRLIWFGHSAFLLQMDGKNILIDPMFGKVPLYAHSIGSAAGDLAKNCPLKSKNFQRSMPSYCRMTIMIISTMNPLKN